MYKLVNVHNPKKVLDSSTELVTLWQKLDNKEYKYMTPVIINDDNEIVAGHETAWNWAELKNFTLA